MSKPAAKQTARNNTYLAAIKRLFNEKIYAACLAPLNTERAHAVESYLAKFMNGSTNEEAIRAALASIGRM